MRVAFLGNFQVSYSSETHHAASLEQLGHIVHRLQEPKTSADAIANIDCDLFVWVHTHGWQTPGIEGALQRLKQRGIPIVAYHLDLYMGLQRWRDYESDPYMRLIDHWFTVDQLMADWLNQNTDVTGHYLPAAVFGPECYISSKPSEFANDVVFVGSKGYHREWPYRPKLIDWLSRTYGDRFTHIGGGGKIGNIRGDALNRLYANSKVVVGDTLCLNFDYPHYWSDRCPETLGRGGMLIHPAIRGMDEHYVGGEHLAYYTFGDFDQLKSLIDHYLVAEAERERIRKAGHEHVKASQTYSHRWASILETIGGDLR